MDYKNSNDRHVTRQCRADLIELLSLSYVRLRQQQARKYAKKYSENFLDDVAWQGTVRATENRTSEKGASSP